MKTLARNSIKLLLLLASVNAYAVDPNCDIRTNQQVVEDALAKEAKAAKDKGTVGDRAAEYGRVDAQTSVPPTSEVKDLRAFEKSETAFNSNMAKAPSAVYDRPGSATTIYVDASGNVYDVSNMNSKVVADMVKEHKLYPVEVSMPSGNPHGSNYYVFGMSEVPKDIQGRVGKFRDYLNSAPERMKSVKGQKLKIGKYKKADIEYYVDEVTVTEGKKPVVKGRVRSGTKGKFKKFEMDFNKLEKLSKEYDLDVAVLENMSPDELVFLEWARDEKLFTEKQRAKIKEYLTNCRI